MPIKKSTIFSAIYAQIAKQKNDLLQKAGSRLNQLIDSFIQLGDNNCPDEEFLNRVIQERNNITLRINSLNVRINQVSNFLSTIRAFVTVINTIITTIKVLPLPAAFANVGFIVTLSDVLAKVQGFLKEILDGIVDLDDLFQSTSNSLEDILAKLRQLDVFLAVCSDNLNVLEVQQTALRDTDGEVTYKGYTLLIKEDPRNRTENLPAPLRYAAGFIGGVQVIRGDSSFSSSTDVLIQELKFIIDNQLIKN